MKSRKRETSSIDLEINFSDGDIAAFRRRDTHMKTEDYLRFLESLGNPSSSELSRRSGPKGEKFQLPY
jgi:hypothetical protein